MADHQSIMPGMRVVGPDGQQLGAVDHADADGIKLAKNSTADGHHHHIAADLIDRVEGGTIYLNGRAAAIMSGAGASSHAAAATGAAAGRKWLPLLLAAIAAIVLLLLLLKGCDRDTTNPPVSDGQAANDVAAAPNGLAGDVNTYLASTEAVPRTFTFDRLNFDTGKAEIRDADRGDIEDVAAVLGRYPDARIRIVGYTDAKGAPEPNAQLGYERAQSVAEALTDKGVAKNRIETASGGESDPIDSNATKGGRSENRRTELVVLSR